MSGRSPVLIHRSSAVWLTPRRRAASLRDTVSPSSSSSAARTAEMSSLPGTSRAARRNLMTFSNSSRLRSTTPMAKRIAASCQKSGKMATRPVGRSDDAGLSSPWSTRRSMPANAKTHPYFRSGDEDPQAHLKPEVNDLQTQRRLLDSSSGAGPLPATVARSAPASLPLRKRRIPGFAGTFRKRTTGVEPATFGLGSRRSTN